MRITLGADPELFLINKDGKFISAVGKIPGTKEHPQQIGASGWNIHTDNVALEFNIPPARQPEEFVENVRRGIYYAEAVAGIQGLTPVAVPAVNFDWDELDTPQAQTFGCIPDFNAFTLEEQAPDSNTANNLRTAGGHIHIGLANRTSELSKIRIVRLLEAGIGSFLRVVEPPNDRTKLYGSPGSMRMKPYGLEWRSPSNYWLGKPDRIVVISNAIFSLLGTYYKEFDSRLEIVNYSPATEIKNRDILAKHFWTALGFNQNDLDTWA